MFYFESISFGHNHVIDELTGAKSANLFDEYLERSIAGRKRNGGALFIVTVKILAPTKNLKNGSPASIEQIRRFEESLQKTSQTISRNIRAEDFYTRMSVDGFYILIKGESRDEANLTERYKRLFADRSLYQVNKFQLVGDMSSTEWLNEIDEVYFQ